jgi:hypothetical protein
MIPGSPAAGAEVISHPAEVPGAPNLIPALDHVLPDGLDDVIVRNVRDVLPIDFIRGDSELCREFASQFPKVGIGIQ